MNTYKKLLRIVSGISLNPWEFKNASIKEQDCEIYKHSLRIKDSVLFYAIRCNFKDYLILMSSQAITFEFDGKASQDGGKELLICEETTVNCRELRKLFPDMKPVPVGKEKSTFGVGDRLGSAILGHLNTFAYYPAYIPILAQQSLRELDLTGRTYQDVIDAATWGVFKTGYRGAWGADGDHLKAPASVQSALGQGCTMITADLSDHLDFSADALNEEELTPLYRKLPEEYRSRVENEYLPLKSLDAKLTFDFSQKTLMKLVITYKAAIDFALVLYNACKEVKDQFDFEISIDETSVVTSIEAHYFIARELQLLGIPFTGIAPRYAGEFQKGIDYRGDLKEFASHYALHAELAARMGYKISVHSSSDKFSAYPIIKEKTIGPCHLKTAGTNWLVALQVVGTTDPALFRELFEKAYEVFETAKSYYHITPDWSIRTDIGELKDSELLFVFNNDTDRQVMHVAYGELKKVEPLWARFEINLARHLNLYSLLLEEHIGHHLGLLS